MAKKGGTQTVQQNLDPQSQAYVNKMRLAATQGSSDLMNGGPLFEGPDTRPIGEQILPYMNAFTQGVVDPTRAEFDYLRAGASREAGEGAIRAGAFGGSRHGVAEGVRLGALDRAQASTIADLNRQGYDNALSVGLPHLEQQRFLRERQMQEPLFRRMQALQMLNMGMGPTGSTQSQQTEQGWGPQLLGLGMLAAAPFTGGATLPFAGGAMSGAGGNSGTPYQNPSFNNPRGYGYY